MSYYRPVYTRIWRDEKFLALSAPAQRVFLYLLTSPHTTQLPGCYVAPDFIMARDLGCQRRTFMRLMTALSDVDMAYYDPAAMVVALPNAPKWNPPANANVCIGWGKCWSNLSTFSKIDVISDALVATFGSKGAKAGPFLAAFLKGLGQNKTEIERFRRSASRQNIIFPGDSRGAVRNGSRNGLANGSPNGSGNRFETVPQTVSETEEQRIDLYTEGGFRSVARGAPTQRVASPTSSSPDGPLPISAIMHNRGLAPPSDFASAPECKTERAPDGGCSAEHLNNLLMHNGYGAISAKWWPTALRLAPFGDEELRYARSRVEAANGRPNAGLLLKVVERYRADRERKPTAPAEQPRIWGYHERLSSLTDGQLDDYETWLRAHANTTDAPAALSRLHDERETRSLSTQHFGGTHGDT